MSYKIEQLIGGQENRKIAHREVNYLVVAM
jgi:hypothetical protein